MDHITCRTCGERKAVTPDNFYYHQKGKLAGKLVSKLDCRPCFSARANRYGQDARATIIAHYGAVCACCGETGRSFLQIDHVNGDGARHRKSTFNKANRRGTGTLNGWRDIIEQGFPDWVQILCANCNRSKGVLAGRRCPEHHPEDYPGYSRDCQGAAAQAPFA